MIRLGKSPVDLFPIKEWSYAAGASGGHVPLPEQDEKRILLYTNMSKNT